MTFVANCFVFSDMEKEFINGFTSAFAIYIAYDRLKGKWKTLNQQFEQDIKQDSIWKSYSIASYMGGILYRQNAYTMGQRTVNGR